MPRWLTTVWLLLLPPLALNILLAGHLPAPYPSPAFDPRRPVSVSPSVPSASPW